MKRTVLASLVLLTCSEEAPTTPASVTSDGSCALTDVAYSLSYLKVSGDCPEITTELLLAQAGELLTVRGADGLNCQSSGSCRGGNIAMSSDCSARAGTNGETHSVTSLDVRRGTGVYSIRVLAGAETCSGYYELTLSPANARCAPGELSSNCAADQGSGGAAAGTSSVATASSAGSGSVAELGSSGAGMGGAASMGAAGTGAAGMGGSIAGMGAAGMGAAAAGGPGFSSPGAGGTFGAGGSPAATPVSPFPGGVGAPCTTTAECAGSPMTCIQASSNAAFQSTDNPEGGGPQGGYCTAACASNADCTAVDEVSVCNTELGFCFALCLPGAGDAKCGADRAQLCLSIVADSSLGACIPRCTSDASCGAGRFCNPGLVGVCVDTRPSGGAVGAPCSPETEAEDCASGLCVEYGLPGNTSQVAGSFCSANCTAGLANGCGFDALASGVRQSACFSAQLAGGGVGDLGYCAPLCDTTEDCPQANDGWVCDPFDDANAEQQVGRLGECVPEALVTDGPGGPIPNLPRPVPRL